MSTICGFDHIEKYRKVGNMFLFNRKKGGKNR